MVALGAVTLFALCFVQPIAGSGPVANVRLLPPPTVPGIDEELHSLDAARASSEGAGFEKLDVAYGEALRNGEARIGKVVAELVPGPAGAGKSSGFMAVSSGDGAGSHFRLKVSPMRAPSRAVKQRVKLIEGVRAAQEDALISQGVRELQLLVDIVVGELSSALAAVKLPQPVSSALGFLQSSKAADILDVRFLPPDEPFPTVAGLVRAMESRRAESEQTVRQHIAEIELKLLHALNSMVESALRQRLARW